MSADMAVSIKGLGKRFRVYKDPTARVLERLSFGKLVRHEERWPFRGLDLEVERGSAMGIIGRNGVGKSTMLKIVSGIMDATEGSAQVRGSLGSLLELGGGFHPAFSGRRNIFMSAAIMGIPQSEVRERIPEVIAFSELGPAIDRPVRTYSSGMVMRLGFSIATMKRPDVLILDEVMAVGDQEFQAKCMDRMSEIRGVGTTILFVSHSMYHIRQMCDRAVWLQDGEFREEGAPVDVTDEYLRWMHSKRITRFAPLSGPQAAEGEPRLKELKVRVAGQAEDVTRFTPKQQMEFIVTVDNPGATGRFHVDALVSRNDDVPVFTTRSEDEGVEVSGDGGALAFRLENNLAAGEYYVSVRLTRAEDGEPVDVRSDWGRFIISYEGMETGLFLPECKWMTPQEART